jgi:beta-1,4-mannosyltransferase
VRTSSAIPIPPVHSRQSEAATAPAFTPINTEAKVQPLATWKGVTATPVLGLLLFTLILEWLVWLVEPPAPPLLFVLGPIGLLTLLATVAAVSSLESADNLGRWKRFAAQPPFAITSGRSAIGQRHLVRPQLLGEWSYRPFSAHRLRVVVYITVGVLVLYALQAWLWPVSRSPHTAIEEVWSWGSLLWLGAVLPGGLGLAGMLKFRHPKQFKEVKPIDKLVAWRIVSRGTNTAALTATIRRCQAEMSKTPLFPYVIEVVTDARDVDLPPPNQDLRYLAVPSEYRTPNGSLYKARALQYAVEHSPLHGDAWIVHLDEETQPTASGIKGICAMIREEEASGAPRIGQGALLYHRKWREHPVLTLADNVRTGDDFARFHFQHKLGVTIFGLHGSYIVVRNDVEKSIGFDFGPKGSITEDAFWALVAMERGYRCRWVDGYLEEQSTESIADFVRQRRRWFQGLVKVSIHAPVKLRWRFCLGLNTFLWSLAPFASLYTVGHLFYGFSHEWWIRFLANDSFSAFTTLYLIGLVANLREHGVNSLWKRAGWTLAQIVLLPLFNLMEGMGVLAAIFRPVSGFHVVKK